MARRRCEASVSRCRAVRCSASPAIRILANRFCCDSRSASCGLTKLLVTKALHEIPYLARRQARGGAQDVSAVEVAGYVPGVQVCLLEEGKIAFFGSPQEFAQSSMPAVQHMPHPMTEATYGELDVDDPWRQNRKTRRFADIETT